MFQDGEPLLLAVCSKGFLGLFNKTSNSGFTLWLTNFPLNSTSSENRPKLNPARSLITGVICGVRVEDITDPTMQTIRYLDKLIDELAKSKPMEKILRKA
jgi:hypothetical protein